MEALLVGCIAAPLSNRGIGRSEGCSDRGNAKMGWVWCYRFLALRSVRCHVKCWSANTSET